MLAILFGVEFQRTVSSSAKEKESCCLVFPFSTKRKIRHLPVEDPGLQIRERGWGLSRPWDKGGGEFWKKFGGRASGPLPYRHRFHVVVVQFLSRVPDQNFRKIEDMVSIHTQDWELSYHFTWRFQIIWQHKHLITSRLSLIPIKRLYEDFRWFKGAQSRLSYLLRSVWKAKTIFIFFSPRRVSPFLPWGDFHARSRFARSSFPEDKWGTTRSLAQNWPETAISSSQSPST